MGLDIYLIKIVKRVTDDLNWLSLEENPELENKFDDLIMHNSSNNEKGFYYEEISYQHKGVKRIFYKKYLPDEFIFSFEELNKLKKCILPDYLESFEMEFIKKFEEGKTIILMSY